MKGLLREFSTLRILQRRGIDYLDIPFFNHSKATDPALVREAVDAICAVVDWKQHITKIVSEEEYGGFLAVCVAMEQNIPFTLAKQDSIHAIDGLGITFKMAYNEKMQMYVNGIKGNDRVVIIDDIVSTGGTMIALIQALQKAQVTIVDVVALVEKTNEGGVKRIKKETGYDIKTIIQIDTSQGKPKLISTIFDKPSS